MKIIREGRDEFKITNNELQAAFPELYSTYKDTYGSKRPSISVSTETTFAFHPTVTDWSTDLYSPVKYFFYQNGHIVSFDAGVDGGEGKVAFKNYNLSEGDAVLVCHYGYTSYAQLTVHPSFINQKALPVSDELDIVEEYVLLIHKNYMSAYRYKNFLGFEWQGAYSMEHMVYPKKEMIDAIKNIYGTDKKQVAFEKVKQSLASKGLIAINSAGSSKLTPKGTNVALQLAKNSKYIKKYN